jgi:hypothetical protein
MFVPDHILVVLHLICFVFSPSSRNAKRVLFFASPYRKDDYEHSPLSDSDYAVTHNLTPFVSMQNHHNLVYREEEREMMPTLKVSLTSTSHRDFQNDVRSILVWA